MQQQETRLIGSGSGSASALQAIPKRRRRNVRIEINSNDRNLVTSPSTSSFRWVLKYPLKGVSEVRIVNGQVPIPSYNIDDGWNRFSFQEGLQRKTIVIPPGLYTPTTVATQLQTLLNSSGFINTYSVSIDPITECLRVQRSSGSQTFGFCFGSGTHIDQIDTTTNAIISVDSPQTLLGFGYADTYDRSGLLLSPFPVQLDFVLRRIYIYINFDSTIDLRSVDRGQGRKEPSAILYIDPSSGYGSYRTLNQDNYDSVMDCGTSGLSRVASVQVEFRDEFGRLLNFRQRPVSLLLELTVVE